MRTSLKDIAKHVGVSVSTVSYALNDGPKPVAAELKERIKQAAAELDYRPNRVARSMKTKRSGVVGILHPRIGPKFITWPMLGSVISGVVDESQARRQDVLIYTHSPSLETDEVLDLVMDGRADGLILLGPQHNDEMIDSLAERKVPLSVVAGRPRAGLPYHVINNRVGVWQAMSHLAKFGHTKIAHITGRKIMYDGQERLVAYRDFMAEHGWPVREDWVQAGTFESADSYCAAKEILTGAHRPTAIFCANDRSAVGAIQAALDLGMEVPRDISIIGFDDSLDAVTAPVPITTVRQPFYEMGRAAMESVMAMIENRPYEKVQVFSTELIERATVSYPTEDQLS